MWFFCQKQNQAITNYFFLLMLSVLKVSISIGLLLPYCRFQQCRRDALNRKISIRLDLTNNTYAIHCHCRNEMIVIDLMYQREQFKSKLDALEQHRRFVGTIRKYDALDENRFFIFDEPNVKECNGVVFFSIYEMIQWRLVRHSSEA